MDVKFASPIRLTGSPQKFASPIRLTLFASLALLAACGRPEIIRVPGPVEYRDRIVIQPIAPDLLRPHPIAEGPLRECPAVASARRAELQACNADKSAISEQQGLRDDENQR